MPDDDTPMQRLLLATEHTEFDSGAEAFAFALAAAQGGGLPAVMPLATNAEFEASAPALADRADAEFAARRERLMVAAAQAGIRLDLRVRRGAAPHAEIVAQAREDDADLLIIRRRGKRGWLARLLVGEMVREVLAQAPCHVLVAPRIALPCRRGVVLALGDGGERAALAQAARALSPGLPQREAASSDALTVAEREGADLLVVARADPACARLVGEARCAVLVVV
jgi:nucleotide-binding universal stress UspA family protein